MLSIISLARSSLTKIKSKNGVGTSPKVLKSIVITDWRSAKPANYSRSGEVAALAMSLPALAYAKVSNEVNAIHSGPRPSANTKTWYVVRGSNRTNSNLDLSVK